MVQNVNNFFIFYSNGMAIKELVSTNLRLLFIISNNSYLYFLVDDDGNFFSILINLYVNLL